MTRRNHLPKAHRLCSQTAIDRLFLRTGADRGGSALAYPLRAVWAPRTGAVNDAEPVVRFLISIPKKRLRHAVDRVQMRRRVRESYRLLRPDMLPACCGEAAGAGKPLCVDVAFIYVADELTDYRRVHSAMKRLLRKIAASAPEISHETR